MKFAEPLGENVRINSQTICILSGPIGFLMFGLGIWPLAHFLPPLAPSATAEDIAGIYQANTLGIRLGAVLVMLGASLFAPFFAQISVLMKRMEGDAAPWALTQLVSGTVVVVAFFLAPLIFSVAAFRPERAPEATQLINDLGWITLVIPVLPAVIQTLAIGFAIFGDKNPRPVLPRWFGFFSLWVAVLFLPGCLAAMFKTGPFAWNGLLAFWVPAVIVGLWSNVMAFLMLAAVGRQDSARDDK